MTEYRPPARRPASQLQASPAEYDDTDVIGLPQVATWLQRRQTLLLGLALIAAALIWKSAFLHAFYFRQDDFHFTELADQYGLSWKYLGYVGSGHLHPGVLLLVWLLARAAPYDWAAATWMTLVLVALSGLACLRMLRTLMGSRLAVLIPLALFLVTPLTMPDDSWWTSAIESLPLQITIFLAVTSQVLYVRSGRFRHALAAAGWLVLGLVFFEKAIVIPVVLFAVTAGFLTEGHIFTSVRVALTRYWRAWALYLVIGAAYLVILLNSLRQSTVQPKPTSLGASMTFSWSLIRQSLLPGLLGGPWRWAQFPGAAVAYTSPSSSMVWLSVAATCAIVGISIAFRPRAWRGWAVLALWVIIADIVPLLLGRLATTGFDQILGLDTRYVADAAALGALAVALVFWPVAPGRPLPALPAGSRQARAPAEVFATPGWRLAGVALAAIVVIGSLLSVSRYQQATALYDYSGNVYLTHVRAALADQPPGTVIVNGTMPPYVEDSAFYEDYSRQSRALAPLEGADAGNIRWASHFDGNISRLMMLDGSGNLRKAAINVQFGGAAAQAPPSTGCFPYAHGVATIRFSRLPGKGTGVIRLGYIAAPAEAGQVVTIRYGSQARQLRLAGPGQLHAAYFSVTGSASTVTVTVPGSAGGAAGSAAARKLLCVGDVEAGNLSPTAS